MPPSSFLRELWELQSVCGNPKPGPIPNCHKNPTLVSLPCSLKSYLDQLGRPSLLSLENLTMWVIYICIPSWGVCVCVWSSVSVTETNFDWESNLPLWVVTILGAVNRTSRWRLWPQGPPFSCFGLHSGSAVCSSTCTLSFCFLASVLFELCCCPLSSLHCELYCFVLHLLSSTKVSVTYLTNLCQKL